MPFDCPVCRQRLDAHPCARGFVYACRNCGGVWLGNVLAQALLAGIDAGPIVIAESAGIHAASPFPPLARGAPCPECAAPLVTTMVTIAAIEVDLCAAHGTWFERHELQAIAAAHDRVRVQAREQTLETLSGPVPASNGVFSPSEDDYRPTLEGALTSAVLNVALNVLGSIIDSAIDDDS